MNQKDFIDDLNRFRKENRYTREQIAKSFGISPACFYRWEYRNALSDSSFDAILNKNY